MGHSVTYKILKSHLLHGRLVPGEEIGIRIDQTLTQDATGTMAYLQFETMNIPRVRTGLSVSYVDHNTLQTGFENADDHRYLQSMNPQYGIYYSRAGNGICHQVHLERFGRPGATLLGSDSHTPTGGGLGMVAIGAGGLDVAVAMGGGAFYLSCPRMIQIRLLNSLRPGVSAKDAVLAILGMLTTRGNVGYAVEYTGPGVRSLSVPERATMANMGAELGVTTSVFSSDDMTKRFLKAQGRGDAWREILPDDDAEYERVYEIDLFEIEPMVACPHSPDNVKRVDEVKGIRIDQVAIGTCTNSSYRDLATVAKILAGRRVHPDVSLVIAPGSRQVFQMIARESRLATMIESGARIMEAACGFCIGAGQAPPTGGISLRTGNRNFEGRSGTETGRVYLVSPETAALSAVEGALVSPVDFPASRFPRVKMPKKFLIDDSMIIPPSDNKTEIIRGPNIGGPPRTEPLQNAFRGFIGLKVGDNISTDHIMPAGPRLKYRSNIPAYSQFVFEGIDPDFSKHALANREKGMFTAIAGGHSYGQGSSREHAALCPLHLGVRMVMAKSFERIHAANLINFGIAPLMFADASDYERIEKGDEFSVTGLREAVRSGDSIAVAVRGVELRFTLFATERQREILLEGGLLNYTVKPDR